MEDTMSPEERRDFEKLLAIIDFDHRVPLTPMLDPAGPALVFTADVSEKTRQELIRQREALRGPSKYKDLPEPVIDIKAGGKAEKPWRLVAPMEFADLIQRNLQRIGYPNSSVYSYREGGHATNNEGRPEMAWRQWPEWGFTHMPYYVETDAPRHLVEDLIEKICASEECRAWIDNEYGFKGYTEEEWAISADNPDNA